MSEMFRNLMNAFHVVLGCRISVMCLGNIQHQYAAVGSLLLFTFRFQFNLYFLHFLVLYSRFAVAIIYLILYSPTSGCP